MLLEQKSFGDFCFLSTTGKPKFWRRSKKVTFHRLLRFASYWAVLKTHTTSWFYQVLKGTFQTCCSKNWSWATFQFAVSNTSKHSWPLSKTFWFGYIGTNSRRAVWAPPVPLCSLALISCSQKWLQWAFSIFFILFFSIVALGLLRPCCLNFFHADLLFRLLRQIEVRNMFRCSTDTDHFFLRSSPASPKLWGLFG